jgi:excisionase family DNA binding protein
MLERRYGGFDYGIVATDAPRRQTDTRIAAFSPVPVARLVAVQNRRLSVVRADLTHDNERKTRTTERELKQQMETVNLNSEQTIQFLNISKTKYYELVHDPTFYPAFRIGRKILVNREQLCKWLESQKISNRKGVES